MPTYRIEISPNNRATCKNAKCKKEGIKLTKGETRFGTWVEIEEHGSWQWRHWGCVTPLVLANLQGTCEGDMDLVDGYEDMPADMQQKIKRALEQGHVDDADWRGDVEFNRPGKKGFEKRKPKAKKNDDGEAEEEVKKTPKAAGKKRKATDGEDADEEAVPVKKPRKKAVKAAPAEEEAGEEAAPAKKPSKKAVASKKAVKEEDEDEAEVKAAPVKKGRGRPNKAAFKDDNEAEDKAEDKAELVKAPVKRGRKKVVKEESEPEMEDEAGDAEEMDVEPEPKKKAPRGRPKKAEAVVPQKKARGKKA